MAVALAEQPVARQAGCQLAGPVAVDLHDRRETDRLPVGDQHPVGVVAERAPQRRQRGPQARAGRLLVHVRPQVGRDQGARLAAGVQRQPRQQQPRGPAVGSADSDAVGEDPDIVDQLHLVHESSVQRP